MKWICTVLIFMWMIIRVSDGLFTLINWLLEYLIVFPIKILCSILFGYDD